MRHWSKFIAACLLWASLGTFAAAAHPLGNFTINHLAKVRVEPGKLIVRYVVDMAEIPTFAVLAERRIPAAGTARAAGLSAWGRDEVKVVMAGLTIDADGTRLPLEASVPVVSTRPGAGGLPLLYFVDDLTASFPSGSAPRTLDIADANYADRIGWKDIVVFPQTEPTHELRAYPNALLGSPRSIVGVSVRLGPQAQVVAVRAINIRAVAPAGSVSQVRSNLLSDLLAKGSSNFALVALTLLVALGLGALHALEPGHGKTLLAVSLVGARATVTQACLLATALTVAHTAGVIALGIALLAFARFIVPENVYPWVALGSGVCVAALGASTLARRIRAMRGFRHSHDPGHGHHHHGVSGGAGHSHSHDILVAAGGAPLSFRSVVLVAMSGNIAPCPAALVVLLTALSLQRLGYGMLVVVAFSVGLAAMLTGLGIGVVRGAAWLKGRKTFESAARYGPLVTALIICTIGVLMLAQAAAAIAQLSAWLIGILIAGAIGGYALAPGHSHTRASEGAGHIREEAT